MVYQRMFQSVISLLIAGLTFAACSSPAPETPQLKYCTAKCDCEKCVGEEKSKCNDDIVNLGEEASQAKCKDNYDAYLTCLNTDGVCADGAFDDSACFNEETDLHTCIKPPPVCMTVNNGICNEPPPLGDGTCATGTDTKDCMAPTCPTTNDGVCDEPQGTGTCPAGSDTIDCPCLKCFSYASNQSAGTLCAASNTVFSALYSCACGTCSADCGNLGDICDSGSLSATCENCLSSMCSTQFNSCLNDP